jgi:hypothetical protein
MNRDSSLIDNNQNFRRPIMRTDGRRQSRSGSRDRTRNSSKTRIENLRLKIEIDKTKQKLEEQKIKFEKKEIEIMKIKNNFNKGGEAYENKDMLYPNLEAWHAMIILIINLCIPGLGTMLIACGTRNYCSFFCLGLAQAFLRAIISFAILLAYNMQVDNFFHLGSILTIILSSLWPMFTSFKLLKHSM